MGVAPLTVQFTDQSAPGAARIASWLWSFGDGATATAQHPSNTYLAPGVYAVSLNVTTSTGTDTATKADCITVAAAEGEGEGEGEFTGFVEVPQPLSGSNPVFALTATAVPEPGQSVADPDFGTSQRRVISTEKLRHEYSRFDPFNATGSLILLQAIADGEWRVYRTQTVPYDQASNLLTTVEVEEPRWDPLQADVLWGIQDFKLLTFDVQAKQATVVKDFSTDTTIGPILAAQPDLYRITMRDEGESSADKRHWAFLIQGAQEDYRVRCLFTWDRQQDKVLGVYTLPESESRIDWAGMSPKGTWVLIGGDWDNGGKLNGLVMANKELTQFHQLDYATAHADVGLDSDGNEVLVMQGVRTDYVDLLPLELATKPISDPGGSYDGTNRVPLVRLFYDDDSPVGLKSGVHISCNFPGWCVVSTYIEPGLPAQNWLDRKIALVKLDRGNPRCFYLAKVPGTRGEYWEETQAAMSNDGSRVVWATNWNQHVGEERVWLMQLDLPPGWTSAKATP
jgi:PKD repeat protein